MIGFNRVLILLGLILFSFAWCSRAVAREEYLIVGGGPYPEESQVSIEENVLWFEEILRAKGIRELEVLFGSGNHQFRNVKLIHDESDDKFVHLARVYLGSKGSREYFRESRLKHTAGQSSKCVVKEKLDSVIRTLSSNDSLLFIYSGHGSFKPDNTLGNALRLWDKSSLSVLDLVGLLKTKKPGAKLRFVLPQCYSGAFANIIFNAPSSPSIQNINPGVCGFLSVSDHEIAEGCTSGVDVGDYRDYATYFFSAIESEDRLGNAIKYDPDLNGNGDVSLREAHFYALSEGYSHDVPRSTSEYFLELWEPWFLRWYPNTGGYDNEFSRLVMHLEEKLFKANAVTALAVISRMQDLDVKLDAVNEGIKKSKLEEKKLKKRLQFDLELQWPELNKPYTAEYHNMISLDISDINAWLHKSDDFEKLLSVQHTIDEADEKKLAYSRDKSMYMRLMRLRRLAKLRYLFGVFADENEKETYDELLQCENWVIPELVGH